jgi:hypothetical protein
MAGTIKLTREEWAPIAKRLSEECPKSWTTITFVQKRELGFTVRNHREYPEPEDQIQFDRHGRWVSFKDYICLDFYDDVKETYFRMKYL